MKKRILTLGILFLLVFSAFIPMSLGFNIGITNTREQPSKLLTNGNTLYVGGTGDGNYTKIQDAINDAFDGDTVFVYDRLSPYHELLVIDNSINLIGEDRETTVIDGDYLGTVVDIQADDVTVSGFTIIECKKENSWQNSVINIKGSENVSIKDNIISIGPEFFFKPYIASIYLESSSNILIQDNIIFDDSDAPLTYGIIINLFGNSPFNNVSGNEIYGYCNGISINSEDNIIYGNYIHNNGDGIDNHGNKNNIINNTITDNKYEGIRNAAEDTLISSNTITYNGGGGEFHCGISFIIGSNNHFKNNIISNNNPTGVYILVADNNYITDNHISNNNIVGVYSNSGYNNVISRNNFIDNNIENAYDTEENYWDNDGMGNYWDDYTGEDNDGDYIGDSPYDIPGGGNKDNYPLMEPYTGFDPDAPKAPNINGPTSGKPNIKYAYTFVTTDPNEDDVYYYITWGDGSREDWIGPYNSGEMVTVLHTWNKKATYQIIARARDTNDLIGPWGTLKVTMPRNRAINTPFQWFLQQHPNLFLLLQTLMQRLGLQ